MSETERKIVWGGGNGIRSDLGMEIRRFDTALNSFKRPRLMDRYRIKRRYHVTNIRQALYFITLYTYYVLSDDPFVVSPEISTKPFFACLIDHYAYVIFRVCRYGIEIEREKYISQMIHDSFIAIYQIPIVDVINVSNDL